MKRRKPQPRCKCNHARKNHDRGYITIDNKMNMIDKWLRCGYCYDECLEFEQDNLKTLEGLYAFQEQKESSTLPL